MDYLSNGGSFPIGSILVILAVAGVIVIIVYNKFFK
jgi:hypothetical protein